ncbi:MAG: GNAT family N-acetyltransferase [Actinomycetota bacterium]|jgi:ribosomal protein S18 acetylase RimI-like enzyme|nr:GNAT family N-acetyltransferase [Actinomycetota bacterium]
MPMVTIREIDVEDYPLLEEFLYLAVYQRDPEQPIPRSVVNEPRVRIYIEDFGSRPHDRGLVAEVDGKVVGAAWARVLGGDPPGYGYVDEMTPELAISLLPEYRSKGIGTRLMCRLIEILAQSAYARTSLSVDRANCAARMYVKLGFVVVAERDEDQLMIRNLSPVDQQGI